jgi:hypothetical protein
MKNNDDDKTLNKKKSFIFKDGRLYFNKETERTIFFFLTIIMLIFGAISYLWY